MWVVLRNRGGGFFERPETDVHLRRHEVTDAIGAGSFEVRHHVDEHGALGRARRDLAEQQQPGEPTEGRTHEVHRPHDGL
ncbi:unannotated protein [freshwater metagenome]|uniref:Unannotated protein n=1 Tax=freshwater metagenome TaxID=449393 RepID=A0A6J6VUK3_9ZZZZ